jgi:hypothetical protein
MLVLRRENNGRLEAMTMEQLIEAYLAACRTYDTEAQRRIQNHDGEAVAIAGQIIAMRRACGDSLPANLFRPLECDDLSYTN